jgi:hypothetical protein
MVNKAKLHMVMNAMEKVQNGRFVILFKSGFGG